MDIGPSEVHLCLAYKPTHSQKGFTSEWSPTSCPVSLLSTPSPPTLLTTVFQTSAKSSEFQGPTHTLLFTSNASPYLHLHLPTSSPSLHLLHEVLSDCSNLPDSSPLTIPIVLCFSLPSMNLLHTVGEKETFPYPQDSFY